MDTAYRNVTISGLTCSGATTLIRALSKETGWPHINPASQYVRDYLKRHSLPLSAVKHIPDEDEIENESMTAHYLLHETNYIIGGRLSGWLAATMPDIFRIYVTASVDLRVARFAARENFPIEKARKELFLRESSELEKYKRVYNADLTDISLYNCVIDTSEPSPQESLQQILASIMKPVAQ